MVWRRSGFLLQMLLLWVSGRVATPCRSPSSRYCCLKRSSRPGIEGYHRTTGASAMALDVGMALDGICDVAFLWFFSWGGCVVCMSNVFVRPCETLIFNTCIRMYVYIYMYSCMYVICVYGYMINGWRRTLVLVSICMSCIYILCICICIQLFVWIHIYVCLCLYIYNHTYVLVMFRCIHYYTFSFE